MNRPWRASRLAAVIAVLWLAAVSLVAGASSEGGQAPAAPNATASPNSARWTPPRTPWGDPDLQGIWTSDSANGIPLQRPLQLGTRAELTDEEFAQKVARDERTRTAAQNAVGSFRGDNAWLTKSFRQTSLIVEPADGRVPAYTPGADRRRSPQGTYGEGPLDGPEDFTMYDRCITLGVIGPLMPKIYGNGSRIVQAPGYVAIMYEMVHDARIIPLDGRPHLGHTIRQYLGDSRGRWEGNTLVVETTNLTDRTNAPGGGGIRHSSEIKLIERLTRTADDVLQYEVLIDDPKTYTRPWRISLPLTSPPGYQLLPYDCHEGNLALLQALGGERAEDQALEEDRKKGIIRPRRLIQGLTVPGGPLGPPGPAGGAAPAAAPAQGEGVGPPPGR